jgi:hypothetical protein
MALGLELANEVAEHVEVIVLGGRSLGAINQFIDNDNRLIEFRFSSKGTERKLANEFQVRILAFAVDRAD